MKNGGSVSEAVLDFNYTQGLFYALRLEMFGNESFFVNEDKY